MYTILTDNQITRNRRVHYVFDGEDTLKFSAPTLKDCIEWLQENGTHHFYMDFGDYRAMLYLVDEPGEHHGPITGWLHKPEHERPTDVADAQAATVIEE